MSDEFMLDTDDLERRMDGAMNSLKSEFASLRTGRASASMLEPVTVEAYGQRTPINQVGTVNVPEPRMVTVNVWDKSMVGAVEKAIRESGLGINPQLNGTIIMLPIPELNESLYAQRGFNIIATANDRDKGVNELSAALKRRFNVVVLPLPDDMESEIRIVSKRVGEMAGSLELPVPKNVAEEVARVLAIFRELRGGETLDGKAALKIPTGSLSTAEAIGVVVSGLSHAAYFNKGKLSADGLAPNVLGAIVKDPVQDKAILEEYLETILKKRRDYSDYYAALTELV